MGFWMVANEGSTDQTTNPTKTWKFTTTAGGSMYILHTDSSTANDATKYTMNSNGQFRVHEGGLQVNQGGLTVSAGGLTVSGGMAMSGDATITGDADTDDILVLSKNEHAKFSLTSTSTGSKNAEFSMTARDSVGGGTA